MPYHVRECLKRKHVRGAGENLNPTLGLENWFSERFGENFNERRALQGFLNFFENAPTQVGSGLVLKHTILCLYIKN